MADRKCRELVRGKQGRWGIRDETYRDTGVWREHAQIPSTHFHCIITCTACTHGLTRMQACMHAHAQCIRNMHQWAFHKMYLALQVVQIKHTHRSRSFKRKLSARRKRKKLGMITNVVKTTSTAKDQQSQETWPIIPRPLATYNWGTGHGLYWRRRPSMEG